MPEPDSTDEIFDAIAVRRKRAFRSHLLKWFDANQRVLPWRKNRSPYRVWISEIMLQQTQVATVMEYYGRFMKRFPNIGRLAAADVGEVLKLWEGLGYYRRARQLHAAARLVVQRHGGKFPTDFDSVLALPGIGRYTAGAILSISLDQPHPVLEGNTQRLYARLLPLHGDPKSTASQKRLWRFAERMVPKYRAGDFNQALMEFGNVICKPKSPLCGQCAIRQFCPTFADGLQHEIPARTRITNYETVEEAIVIVRRRGKLLIRQCGEDERWSGLWDFPRYAINSNRPIEFLQHSLVEHFGLSTRIHSLDKTIRHSVTRFRIVLRCYVTSTVEGRLNSKSTTTRWATRREIDALPMSMTGRKIAQQLDEFGPRS